MKNIYTLLFISFLGCSIVVGQNKPSLVNLVSSDERSNYYKLNPDSFSSNGEVNYFRSLVFKNGSVVIIDAKPSIQEQLYKSDKSIKWETVVSEVRKMKAISLDTYSQMTPEEKQKWSNSNLKD